MTDRWSGIVVKADKGIGITSVSGQWTVPNVSPTVSGTSSCYIWVGIDGYGDGYPYVLQAGISCDVKGGKLAINAWWEWTSDPLQPLPEGSFSVLVGDKILCTIVGQLGSNIATISLQNLRTKKFANFPNPVRGRNGVALQGNYAEWVVEAPIENSIQTTLCNYGQVQFYECVARDSSGKTLDPSGGTALNLQQNGQPVSIGSSPAPGQVICTYNGPNTGGSLPLPNAISARTLPAPNTISQRAV